MGFLLMLQILRKLKHENIIEMLDSFETQQEFCVVTEFAQVIVTLLLFSDMDQHGLVYTVAFIYKSLGMCKHV